jgi:hypothetical protein
VHNASLPFLPWPILLPTHNHTLTAGISGRISTLDADLKLKTFEMERLHLLFDEAQANCATANLATERQTAKVELITKEQVDFLPVQPCVCEWVGG